MNTTGAQTDMDKKFEGLGTGKFLNNTWKNRKLKSTYQKQTTWYPQALPKDQKQAKWSP